MYWDHFNLNKRPFAITPDPSLMIWTKQHAQIYDILKREAMSAAPVTLLTGDVGCGKTTILKSLLEDASLNAQCQIVLVSVRLGSARELLQHLLFALDEESTAGLDADDPGPLRDVLDRPHPGGKALFIILDEAHTMATDVVLLLARLAKGELTAKPPPAVLIAGQPELAGLLSRPECRPLSSVVGERVRLGPLSQEEVQDMVLGRLKAAGQEGVSLFDAGAIDVIHAYSEGVPRLVNKLCDLCLFEAARQERQTVDAQFTRQVLEQFSSIGGAPLPPQSGRKRLGALADTFVISELAPSEGENFQIGSAKDAKPERSGPTEPVRSNKRKTAPHLPLKPEIEPGKADQPGPPAALPAPQPTPQRTVSGYMRGALVAAVLAVPLLLLLPTTKDPAPSSQPMSAARVDLEKSAPVSNAAKATLVAKPHSQTALAGDIGPAEKLDPAADHLIRPAFQDTATETFVPADIERQAAIIVTAPPSSPGDSGAAVFFAKALESNTPEETALNYTRAAIRGHARAATYLGQLFETGDGVALNADMAQRWYSVAEDRDRLYQPDFATGMTKTLAEAVEPLRAFVSGETADLIWQGSSPAFSVELADVGAQPIAYVTTSLNAVRVALPDGARLWRVTTQNGTTSGWQPLHASKD